MNGKVINILNVVGLVLTLAGTAITTIAGSKKSELLAKAEIGKIIAEQLKK